MDAKLGYETSLTVRVSNDSDMKSVECVHQWSCCQLVQWPAAQWKTENQKHRVCPMSPQDARHGRSPDAAAHADDGTCQLTQLHDNNTNHSVSSGPKEI